MSGPSAPDSPPAAPSCYRHPGRATYVRCNRCERYICADCMRDAAVGHQCVECVQAGARTIRQPRTRFGGRQRSAAPVVTYALIAINVLAFVLQMASGSLEKQLTLVATGRRRRPALPSGDRSVLALRRNTFAAEYVGAVCRGPTARNMAGPNAIRRAVCTERPGRFGTGLPAVAAQYGDGGCLGRNFRPFRCHIRGGKAAGA